MRGLRKASLKRDILGAVFALLAIAMLWTSPSWAASPGDDTVEIEAVTIVDSTDLDVDRVY